MSQLDPQALDDLASEYVLGTLSAEERLYIQKLIRQDPNVKHRVHVWEERLNPLATAVAPVPPPEKIWRAIEQKIHADRKIQMEEKHSPYRRWWQSAAAAMAGLLLGFGLVFLASDSKVPASYVGVLSPINTSEPIMHASALRHSKQLAVKMIRPIAVAADQALVLWAVSIHDEPRRIGLVSPSDKTVIDLPAEAEIVFKDVSTLAVSVESSGQTTPTVSPSEFLLRGPCVKLW